MMNGMDLAIIIPARNEEKTVADVVLRALHYGKVIVVDDGSDDQTGQLAREQGAVVLRHIMNLGKGAALKTGCEYQLRQGADALVVIDADAQHNPDKIPLFLQQLKTHDVVFGYRTFSRTMPFIFRFGNKFINALAHLLYGIKLRDTQCGYRAFTSTVYAKIRWRSSDYSVESEMVARVGKRKLSYAEIPIETVYLDRYKGTTVFDGVKIVLKMFWWRVS